ncbi:acetyl esterase/lipase [Saccharopolyspora gloriosae]|uniref:Acetyl esterase/lipase n=1 Tax=Saccharopolyspora gloriosae TaxID=455344 RepID=A0A840N5X3_9PSEU|nr:alpha/beta hydrolase [Saccharopolyspora gloriosae]MBB5067380.1 acetyl esterase/lipase [Saccharopolyspora gloriosae]
MASARRVWRAVLAGTAVLTAAALTSGCLASSEAGSGTLIGAAAADLGASRTVADQVYAQRPSGPLALDLFLPAGNGPHPLVVYAHGGGWDAGNRAIDGRLAAGGAAESLAAERMLSKGFAVATVDYRLSDLGPAPAQVEDVAEAVRWLQRHAGDWRLDSERIVLWGASAGGLLVSQLGAVTDDPDEPGGGLTGIRGVVNWFGPTDLSVEAELANPRLSDYSRRTVRKYLGCLPNECPRHADAASPIRNLSGAEPPFLIQHGTKDSLVPIKQSLDFADALRELGVDVALHPYDDFDHGFTPGPSVPMIVDAMDAFLAEHG